MANVTATLQIQFQVADDGGIVRLELDNRPTAEGGINGGKTTFRPGDTVGFLAFQSGFSRLAFSTSAGNVSNAGQGTTEKTEYLVFTADQLEQSVAYPIAQIVAQNWLGSSGGNVGRVGGSPTALVASGSGRFPAVLEVRYTTAYTAHKLSAVPLAVPVAVVLAAGVP